IVSLLSFFRATSPTVIYTLSLHDALPISPEGLRRIRPGAALLVGYRPTAGYAPSSRLAPGQIGRNERHRIYAHDHLVRRSATTRSEEHTSELQSRSDLVCRLLLEKKK